MAQSKKKKRSRKKSWSTNDITELSTFTFPATIPTPPETIEFERDYNKDQMDQKVEDYLYSKYGDQIHYDCAIIRFVIGYRHEYKLKEFQDRLKETEDAFVQFLEWKTRSDFYDILSMKELNGLPTSSYFNGTYVYGANKYGHPIWWERGNKFRKGADLSHHKKLDRAQLDHMVAWFAKLLHEMKFATNKHYGLPTGLEELEDDESVIETEDDQKSITLPKKRSIGIYRHCIVIDIGDLSPTRVLKDREIHEYYAQMGSLVTPEVVFRMYMINASFLFTGIWKIVKGFLHPNTVAKTKILGSDYMDTLLEEIDIHMIPKEYGGKGQWEPRIANIPAGYPIQLLCPYDGLEVP